uniref:Acyl-transferase n=1 Tax=Solanum tuberosum TaxID=4113 RepID=M1AB94_SOLTU
MGAEFSSVRINCHMSEILDHPNASHAESIVFPKDLPWANNYVGGNLLVAQVAAESGVENPTRAEVVSALLFKCAIKATSSTTTSMLTRRPSKFVHFLNVRNMMKSRLPQSAIGNLLSVFSITATNEQDIELPTLVRNLRKGVEVAYKKDQVEENELILEVVESMRKGKKPFDDDYENVYSCSNVCRYPFYNVDFGWGKPERVGLPNGPFKNLFFLKDYKIGRGVDARVMLQKQHMSEFERDEELLDLIS